jgi:hypothetical protein
VSEQPIILTILNNPTKKILKMKKIIINTISIFILLLMVNCRKMILLSVHYRLLQICSSRGLVKQQQPNGDGSGKVNLQQLQIMISYKFFS